jgi:hypothetical protein
MLGFPDRFNITLVARLALPVSLVFVNCYKVSKLDVYLVLRLHCFLTCCYNKSCDMYFQVIQEYFPWHSSIYPMPPD